MLATGRGGDIFSSYYTEIARFWSILFKNIEISKQKGHLWC